MGVNSPGVLHQIESVRAWGRGKHVLLQVFFGEPHAGTLAAIRDAVSADKHLLVAFPDGIAANQAEHLAAAINEQQVAIFSCLPEQIFPDGAPSFGLDLSGLSAALGALDGELTAHPRRVEKLRNRLYVTLKLLLASGAEQLACGLENYSYLMVARQLLRELGLAVEVKHVGIIRDHNGLAEAAVNQHLSDDQYRRALHIGGAIRAALQESAHGASGAAVSAAAMTALRGGDFTEVNVRLLDLEQLKLFEPESAAGMVFALLMIDARLGEHRLRDCALIMVRGSGQPKFFE